MVPREQTKGDKHRDYKSEPGQQVHMKGKETNGPEFDTFPMSSQRAGLSASPANTCGLVKTTPGSSWSPLSLLILCRESLEKAGISEALLICKYDSLWSLHNRDQDWSCYPSAQPSQFPIHVSITALKYLDSPENVWKPKSLKLKLANKHGFESKRWKPSHKKRPPDQMVWSILCQH